MYKVLSILLSYPQQEWLDHLDEMQQYCYQHSSIYGAKLQTLFDYLKGGDELTLQEEYVSIFDRTAAHSLHLFEHIHGEDRERGQAMVNLLNEYQQADFEPNVNELPDYLPLFLEFLSLIEVEKADKMLADAIHVINYIGDNLRAKQCVYSAIFDILVACSKVVPEKLKVAPVRDMDEAMEVFGPNAEGVEPLLNIATAQQEHKLHFYNRKAKQH